MFSNNDVLSTFGEVRQIVLVSQDTEMIMNLDTSLYDRNFERFCARFFAYFDIAPYLSPATTSR